MSGTVSAKSMLLFLAVVVLSLGFHFSEIDFSKAFGKKYVLHNITTSTPKVVILMWYQVSGKRIEDSLIEGCSECLLTENRSKLVEPGVKVVLMHFSHIKLEDMPKTRRKDHVYVWWGMESSLTLRNRHDNLTNLDGIFNMSMTYRRDSDVWNPYGTFLESYMKINPSGHAMTEKQLDDFIKEKTHLALWVVSNCRTNKGAIDRRKYVGRMVRGGLNLTYGGRCAGDKVRRSYNYSKYKFYLAFENSWGCRDYITEKFWRNSLTAGTVPVVIGAPKRDYEAVAPPNSFIYAHDFATPEELVKYLRYLDRNHDAYKRYLRWTTLDVSRVPTYRKSDKLCSLCKIARRTEKLTNSESSLSTSLSAFNFSVAKWFYGTENQACFS